jgi:hypothetical protein
MNPSRSMSPPRACRCQSSPHRNSRESPLPPLGLPVLLLHRTRAGPGCGMFVVVVVVVVIVTGLGPQSQESSGTLTCCWTTCGWQYSRGGGGGTHGTHGTHGGCSYTTDFGGGWHWLS